jgi:arylsulfatase A-like enzyme
MQVGRVLGALDSIGAESTTVVVVCADHVRSAALPAPQSPLP